MQWRKDTSFPFMRIADEYGVDYGVVCRLSEHGKLRDTREADMVTPSCWLDILQARITEFERRNGVLLDGVLKQDRITSERDHERRTRISSGQY